MEMDFEYLCRVCAGNTKGKNSVPECVYILRTPSLQEKIEKYLYLSISEKDHLPKVLCKTCFRQVEATASLSKIAKHTQHVFSEYLFSGARFNASNAMSYGTTIPSTAKSTQRHTDFVDLLESTSVASISSPSQPILNISTNITPPAVPVSIPRKDEVIVNVSINDPLTRETQQKMILESQQKQHNSSSERKIAPKPIAPKPMATRPLFNSFPSTSSEITTPTANVNFSHGQVEPITFSGGYIISAQQPTSKPCNTNTAETKKNTDINSSNNTNKPIVSTNKSPAEVLQAFQQKRNNLKQTLNNIKAGKCIQVSLLKSSVKRSVEHATPRSIAPKTVEPTSITHTLTQSKTSSNQLDEVADVLPDKIIIAAAKNINKSKKSQAIPQTMTKTDQTNMPPKSVLADVPENVLLGHVIKDTDLLKLILKALKWPYTNQTKEAQLQRLRNSNFQEIMSDPNLLQDTDLTQILGPYLAPVLYATAKIMKEQSEIVAATPTTVPIPPLSQPVAQNPTNDLIHAVNLVDSIPFKLPAETSVQLVPVNSSEDEASKPAAPIALKSSLKRDRSSSSCVKQQQQQKKIRKVYEQQKARNSNSIVISDEEDDNNKTPVAVNERSKNKAVLETLAQNGVLATANPTVSRARSDENETLLNLMKLQRDAVKRFQRHRSDSNIISLPATSIDFDDFCADIVLMDQQEPLNAHESDSTADSSTSASSAAPSSNFSTASIQISDFPKPFPVLPATRPIIKRRKTVIQTSPASSSFLPVQEKELNVSNATISITKAENDGSQMLAGEELSKKTEVPASTEITNTNQTSTISVIKTNEVTKVSKSSENEVVEVQTVATSSSAIINIPSVHNTSEIPTVSPKPNSIKKAHLKSTLRQQLLEAIGLEKAKHEENSGNSGKNDSVQQIRFALKKSLKQAQLLQQRKQEEPVKQVADSTTKNVVKEVLVEAKVKQPYQAKEEVDIEEHINKTTLLVENKIDSSTKSAENENKNEIRVKDEIKQKNKEVGRPKSIISKAKKSFTTWKKPKLMAGNESSKSIAYYLNKTKSPVVKQNQTIQRKATSTTSPSGDANAPAISKNPTAKEEENKQQPRKRGRPSKTSRVETPTKTVEEVKIEPHLNDEIDDNDDDQPLVVRAATSVNSKDAENSSRPTRVSKTLSKYYKGPDKRNNSRRSLSLRNLRKK